MKPSLLLFVFTALILDVGAEAAREMISPIGEHYPILRFEKNENPQNIMIAYVKLNDDCKFQKNPDDPEKPLVDFYWLMDRKIYKPVHPLIKRGIRHRTEVIDFARDQEFSLRLKDLKELNQDLEEPALKITAQKNGRGGPQKCAVENQIRLGPSDENRAIQVESIFSTSKKRLLPPFRALTSVTLKGQDAETGESLERSYQSR